MKLRQWWAPLALVSLTAPPVLVLALAGTAPGPYLEFPPLTRYVRQPGFSWPIFIALAALTLAAVTPAAHALWRARGIPRATPAHEFPRWGWVGVALIAIGWPIAWTRSPAFAPVQTHTFLPLWLGYIVTMNALHARRAGWSLLGDAPAYLLGLGALSAVFWWYFEYANRFVQNWYYVGIEHFTAGEYVFFATLSFSTVLPAVVSTLLWLGTFPRLTEPFGQRRPLRIGSSRMAGAVLWGVAVVLLAGLARFPTLFFPLVWVAPLAVLTGVRAAFGLPTVFAPLAGGDYRVLIIAPLAALLCGGLWELWNAFSLAHWEYSIPYVQRFHLFEMPILGYAGYLPFGLECLAVAQFIDRNRYLDRMS